MTVILLLFIVIFLLLFLPVRLGVWGRYAPEACLLRGWARPWNGLCGIQVIYEEKRLHLGPMVWRWAPWNFHLKRGKEPVSEPVEATEPAEVEPEPEAPGLNQRLSAAGLIWYFFRRLRRSVLRFLMRLVGGFRVRRLSCDVVFGASDPVTTGQVFGYALALSGATGPRVELALAPDFDQERLEGEAEVELAVYLHRLLWAVACLACRTGGVGVSYYWNLWRRKRSGRTN